MACDWKQLAGVLAAAGVWTWMSIYSERRKMMEEAAAVVQPAVAGVRRVPPEILNAFPVQFPEKREREREEAMHAHPRARAILQGLALLSNHLNPEWIRFSNDLRFVLYGEPQMDGLTRMVPLRLPFVGCLEMSRLHSIFSRHIGIGMILSHFEPSTLVGCDQMGCDQTCVRALC
ncbi:hypothetical protein ABFS82_06G123700 [Erythranthe guttata]